MLREHVIQFLEAVIVFLLLTNAISVATAAYAVWVAHGFASKRRELAAGAKGKVAAFVRRFA